ASSAISADDLTRVRAVGVVGNHLKTETLGNTQTSGNCQIRLPASFQSALPSPGADASGLRGFILPALRRWLDFSRRFQAPGSLIHSLRIAIQLRQKSFRGCAQAFHSHPLSAGTSGLVAVLDRHECSERKFPHDGKTEARPGNLTARDGNHAC